MMFTHTMTELYEMADLLPPTGTLTLHNVSWEQYVKLSDATENRGLRMSYNEGELQIMAVSPRHETYVKVIERLVDRIGFVLRVKILFFGSATMRKKRKKKANEPDACFYVQSADLLGNRIDIDFETDPPPDIAVEVDVHHVSLSKFPIYVALGVPEIWHYDEDALTIYHLEDDQYVEAETSLALPMLTADKLTEFINRSRTQDQHAVMLAFEKWLKSLRKRGAK